MFKITQKQYLSDGANFHVGKIENLQNNKMFVWVYDCGQLPKSFCEKVDVIYVSHFDKDHIQGAVNLLKNNEQAAVIGPYVSKDDFINILLHLNLDDTYIIDFIFDSYANSINLSKNDAVLYRDGNVHSLDDDAENYGDINISALDWKVSAVLKKQTSFEKMYPNWKLITFSYKSLDVGEDSFKQVDDNDIKKCIKHKHERKKFIERIKGEFKSFEKRKENLISMSLYSGPVFSRGKYTEFLDSYCLRNIPPAWMHTGDSGFRSTDGKDSIYTAFLNKYKALSGYVGTFVLPHHGLYNSQNEKMYTDFPFANFLLVPFTRYPKIYDFCGIKRRLYWTKYANYSTVTFQNGTYPPFFEEITKITEKQLFYKNKSKYPGLILKRPEEG